MIVPSRRPRKPAAARRSLCGQPPPRARGGSRRAVGGRRARGGAAVEFFLLLPLLLLLLYAVVGYAIVFWAYQGLNELSAALAAQVVSNKWHDEGKTLVDTSALDAARRALQADIGGPARVAGWCAGSPVIEQAAGEAIVSVCLQATLFGADGVMPQLSLLGVTLPHLTRASVTATLRLP